MLGYVFVEGFCDWQKLNFLVIELRFARFLFSEFGRFDRVLEGFCFLKCSLKNLRSQPLMLR